jgi:hypothetical protein
MTKQVAATSSIVAPNRVFAVAVLNQSLAVPLRWPVAATRTDDRSLNEFAEIDGGAVLAFFDRGFKLDRIAHGDRYWSQHRQLEEQSVITHSVLACPERTTPGEIRTWTPSSSWQSTAVRWSEW